jgi:hypothetical protein
VVAACGDNKAAEITKGLSDRRGTTADTPAPTNNEFTEGALYSTACDAANLEYGGIRFPGIKTTFSMTDTKFTKQNLYYTDNCRTQSMLVTEAGDTLRSTTSEITPLEVDLSYDRASVVLQNDLIVSAFNLATVCGFSDWELNVEKIITGETQTPGCPVKPAPRAQPLLLLVEGSTLYFGETVDSSSTSGRPVQVDRNLKFIKQ